MSKRKQVEELADKVERDLKLAGLPIHGQTTDGVTYNTLKEMWMHQLGLKNPFIDFEAEGGDGAANGVSDPHPTHWYEKGYDYWEAEGNCRCDVDGVLGGYGHISGNDVKGSKSFLAEVRKLIPHFGQETAADCGAGIGRVTKDLLLDYFDTVDLVEQSPRLLAAAPKFVGRGARDSCNFICIGLQDFTPEENTYDCVWIQWVVGQLHDVDFIKFLQRCKASLKPGGLIIIKDNVCGVLSGAVSAVSPETDPNDGAFVLDSGDSSVMRSLEYFRSLFNHAGMEIVLQRQETSFPDDIFGVFMFALC